MVNDWLFCRRFLNHLLLLLLEYHLSSVDSVTHLAQHMDTYRTGKEAEHCKGY